MQENTSDPMPNPALPENSTDIPTPASDSPTDEPATLESTPNAEVSLSQPMPPIEPPLDEFQSMAALPRLPATPVPPTPPANATVNMEAHPSGNIGWGMQLLIAIVSAISGAVLALAVIAGLNNGSLLLNEQNSVQALQAETSALQQQLDAQTAELTTLRARMDGFGGLKMRIENAESALQALQVSLEKLGKAQNELKALQTADSERIAELESQIVEAKQAAQRFDTFLEGLRLLLNGDVGQGISINPTATP